jgi:transcriptional regulator with XRE-family HTH domain
VRAAVEDARVDNSNDRLGAIIKRTRLAKRWSLDKLAGLSGVTAQTICKLENRQGGNVAAALAVLEALGLEFFPPVLPSRQHLRSLPAGIVVRKYEPVWSTPPHVIAAILKAFRRKRFCLDAASPNPPCQPCLRFFDGLTPETDGRNQTWVGDLVLCNPPYDDLPPWVDHGIAQYRAGHARCIVFIVPARPTKVMRRLRDAGATRFLLESRLKFGGSKNSGRFYTGIYVLGATDAELERLGATLPAHERM